ncbi:hypothetical protein L211DRAFT_473098 [Terfezia boudieri ATCC MYA-4762]|uniref:Uncharacterized protein n=1 Tax=Terfezia boudieri ATCC MYA-4762 TaxID=1051890 RepID=A0A3N4M1U4_9PEZI|nr:hypothetical protein L211DRAFT_473098 [Terfezia boudieri ATCC MYA-4762]
MHDSSFKSDLELKKLEKSNPCIVHRALKLYCIRNQMLLISPALLSPFLSFDGLHMKSILYNTRKSHLTHVAIRCICKNTYDECVYNGTVRLVGNRRLLLKAECRVLPYLYLSISSSCACSVHVTTPPNFISPMHDDSFQTNSTVKAAHRTYIIHRPFCSYLAAVACSASETYLFLFTFHPLIMLFCTTLQAHRRGDLDKEPDERKHQETPVKTQLSLHVVL